jgi:hypothetical protein
VLLVTRIISILKTFVRVLEANVGESGLEVVSVARELEAL